MGCSSWCVSIGIDVESLKPWKAIILAQCYNSSVVWLVKVVFIMWNLLLGSFEMTSSKCQIGENNSCHFVVPCLSIGLSYVSSLVISQILAAFECSLLWLGILLFNRSCGFGLV